MNNKTMWSGLAALLTCIAFSFPAHASLYTNSFGTQLLGSSDCDDCYDGAFSFGAGQSINFFGNTYTDFFVGSNGYVTFGSGSSNFSATPLNIQTVAPMVAGLYTDLDSRGDVQSNVYVNDSVLGQRIVTWEGMGHYSQNYSVRSTFQLVLHSDQFALPVGNALIGFFYDSVTDGGSVSSGFGDGLAAINPGELALYNGSGTGLPNNTPVWFNLNGGTPTTVPEPATLALLGIGLAGMGFSRKKQAV